jgi:hypothetical protein
VGNASATARVSHQRLSAADKHAVGVQVLVLRGNGVFILGVHRGEVRKRAVNEVQKAVSARKLRGGGWADKRDVAFMDGAAAAAGGKDAEGGGDG